MEPEGPIVPGAPASRDIQNYPGLEFFVSQEIPYAMLEKDPTTHQFAVEFLNLLSQDGLPGTAAPVGHIQRTGLMGDTCQYSPSQGGRLVGKAPNNVEDENFTPADKAKTFHLIRDDGQYLLRMLDANGHALALDVGPDTTPNSNKVQIVKIVAIPYRWQRDPKDPTRDPRITYVLVCYTGPSGEK